MPGSVRPADPKELRDKAAQAAEDAELDELVDAEDES